MPRPPRLSHRRRAGTRSDHPATGRPWAGTKEERWRAARSGNVSWRGSGTSASSSAVPRTAARRRRNQQIVAVVVAVLLVVVGVAALSTQLGGDDNTDAAAKPTKTASGTPSASPSTSASPSPSAAAGECTYTKTAEEAAKDVGLPTYDKAKAATYKEPFTATLKTNQGDIVIAMAADKAPCTTNSFRHLATVEVLRLELVPPTHDVGLVRPAVRRPHRHRQWRPRLQFGVENAPADGKYPAGTVAMARTSDPNTNGSQFFLVYKDTSCRRPGAPATRSSEPSPRASTLLRRWPTLARTTPAATARRSRRSRSNP